MHSQHAIIQKLLLAFLAVGCTGLGSWCYANQAPVVNAGNDQLNVATNTSSFLYGEVSDDSTPVASLAIAWTQVSGPAKAQIGDTASPLTLVTITEAGTYTFVLTASDGMVTSTDTTVIVAHVPVPLVILSPSDSQQIEIGKPFVVRWKTDPEYPCEVYYSLNQGRTYNMLTVSGEVRDSLTWSVDTSFRDSTRQGILKVQIYQNPIYATVHFVFVDHAPKVVFLRQSHDSQPFRIGSDNTGTFRVSGLADNGPLRLAAFDARGRITLNAVAQKSTPVLWTHTPASCGILLYRADAEDGPARTGMLLFDLR